MLDLDKVIALKPDSKEALYERGFVNSKSGQYDRAIADFDKLLQIDPTNSGAEYVLGELARRAENWDEAIQRFSAAAKIDPGFDSNATSAFWPS